MKTFAAILTAGLVLAPTLASAAYLCDKSWQAKYGHSCPAGSVFDSATYSCMITSG